MLEKSRKQQYQIDQLSVSEKSYLTSPKRKAFRLNFMTNSIQQHNNNNISSEEGKFHDYVEDFQKDQIRYDNIKDMMKKKFFNIRTQRGNNLINKPQIFENLQPIKQRKSEDPSLVTSSFLTQRRRPSTRKEFSRQIQKVLESTDMRNSERKITNKNHKIRTRSDLNKKNKNVIEKEKDLILRFVKKNNSVDIAERKWSDISNKEKFTMNFQEYSKRKTQREIDKYIYQHKIRAVSKPLQKFQNFILDQVQFSRDHKQKLSNFFTKMREQFRRAENQQQ